MVVAAVGVEMIWSAGWPADEAADGWYRLDERDELGDVVSVSAGQLDGQGNACAVGDQVVFAAQPAPVDRRGTCVVPPFSARRCEESTIAAVRSSRPAARSSARISSWSCCQTPASCHSFNRRQQVAPEAPNSAVGKSFHDSPVRAANKMPSNAALSGVRRRPGFRNRRCRTGSNGSNRCHNSSVITSSDTA